MKFFAYFQPELRDSTLLCPEVCGQEQAILLVLCFIFVFFTEKGDRPRRIKSTVLLVSVGEESNRLIVLSLLYLAEDKIEEKLLDGSHIA